MHGVLQGFGQDPIPHLKKTSYARKIGTHLPGTFHSNAVSRLKCVHDKAFVFSQCFFSSPLQRAKVLNTRIHL